MTKFKSGERKGILFLFHNPVHGPLRVVEHVPIRKGIDYITNKTDRRKRKRRNWKSRSFAPKSKWRRTIYIKGSHQFGPRDNEIHICTTTHKVKENGR